MRLRFLTGFLGFAILLFVGSTSFGQIDQTNGDVAEAARQVGSFIDFAKSFKVKKEEGVFNVESAKGFYASTQDIVIGGESEDEAPVPESDAAVPEVPAESGAVHAEAVEPTSVMPVDNGIQSGYTPIYSNGSMIGACPPGYTCSPGGAISAVQGCDCGSLPISIPGSIPMDMGFNTPSMPVWNEPQTSFIGTNVVPDTPMNFVPETFVTPGSSIEPSMNVVPETFVTPGAGIGILDGFGDSNDSMVMNQLPGSATFGSSVNFGSAGGAVGGAAPAAAPVSTPTSFRRRPSAAVPGNNLSQCCPPQRRQGGGCFQKVLENIRNRNSCATRRCGCR